MKTLDDFPETPHRMVVIYWYDAWVDEGLTNPEDWSDSAPAKTAGWLIRRTPDVVSVAAEVFPDDPRVYKGVTHIPTVLIQQLLSISEGGEMNDGEI